MFKGKNKICVILVSAMLLLGFGFVMNSNASLDDKLQNKHQEVGEIEKKIEELEKRIDQKQEEKVTLENQITILDTEIEKTQTQIEKTQAEIGRLELEIEKLQVEIEQKKREVVRQKIILGEYIRLMYEYDQVNPLEIIFGYNSFSEFLDQLENLETLENKGQQTLGDIQKLKDELEFKKGNLEGKSKDLTNLGDQLSFEREELDDKKDGKENLLVETGEKEEEFQGLLVKAQEEQQIANQEISAVEERIRKQFEAQKPIDDNWQDVGGTDLAWPINPVQGISAYFMDSSYYTFWGIQHYGIDIPAPQGTAMHAPADGYVAKYRDAGLGYSYIMLYHGNGLSTVYGHASSCSVAEGANVSRGQVIGTSGGTPGTRGSGWMTTGPHLHLETRVNGNPVDPMNYLQ